MDKQVTAKVPHKTKVTRNRGSRVSDSLAVLGIVKALSIAEMPSADGKK